MAIWVVSTFLHLQVILLWMSVYKLRRCIFSILLGLYWGVGLLDHMVILWLAFWGTARLLSQVAVPFYQPLWGLQFLHIFVQFSSVAQSRPTHCDHMDRSTPGFPVHHQLPELAQTRVHQVGDAIQPPHPLLSPSPPAFNLSQDQGFSWWVSSLHQVVKVLELQLQPFQWIFRNFSFSPSNEYSGLISFRMNSFDLLAVPGTLKSLLQHHTLKTSILWHSAFFIVQLSHPYMTTGKTLLFFQSKLFLVKALFD